MSLLLGHGNAVTHQRELHWRVEGSAEEALVAHLLESYCCLIWFL